MGANTIFNLLNRAEILMITEGLDVFSQKTPKSLVGEKLKDSKIREKTGCSIVAVKGNGERRSLPLLLIISFLKQGKLFLLEMKMQERIRTGNSANCRIGKRSIEIQ